MFNVTNVTFVATFVHAVFKINQYCQRIMLTVSVGNKAQRAVPQNVQLLTSHIYSAMKQLHKVVSTQSKHAYQSNNSRLMTVAVQLKITGRVVNNSTHTHPLCASEI